MNEQYLSIDESQKKLTTIIYALYASSLIFGITMIIAIIINYVKRDDVKGTWLESHFKWQIKTFWITLLGTIVGGVTALLVIGWFILLVTGIWFIYRIVKGWMNLNDNKAMY
jgi:uncharacterized membrane protein